MNRIFGVGILFYFPNNNLLLRCFLFVCKLGVQSIAFAFELFKIFVLCTTLQQNSVLVLVSEMLNSPKILLMKTFNSTI